MSCPHGLHSTPERCSQCLGAPVRRIGHSEQGPTIDGAPAGRGYDDQTPPRIQNSRQRGQRARKRRT